MHRAKRGALGSLGLVLVLSCGQGQSPSDPPPTVATATQTALASQRAEVTSTPRATAPTHLTTASGALQAVADDTQLLIDSVSRAPDRPGFRSSSCTGTLDCDWIVVSGWFVYGPRGRFAAVKLAAEDDRGGRYQEGTLSREAPTAVLSVPRVVRFEDVTIEVPRGAPIVSLVVIPTDRDYESFTFDVGASSQERLLPR